LIIPVWFLNVVMGYADKPPRVVLDEINKITKRELLIYQTTNEN